MSLVLDNGDIHHFFALHDGVHHASTPRFRGRYDAAVRWELRRPNAHVVGEEAGGLRLIDSFTGPGEPEALAG